MKKILTLGTLLLGCCLMAFAQTGSSQNQTPQGAAPSAYPQVQTPSEQVAPANPAAMPPDTGAGGQAPQQQAAPPAAASQIATVQGCLSQSADGFMLADNLGNNYQLGGDTSKLAGLIGKEVQVTGMTISNGASDPGSMSSDDASSAAPEEYAQISVSKVRKIADVCSAASATGK